MSSSADDQFFAQLRAEHRELCNTIDAIELVLQSPQRSQQAVSGRLSAFAEMMELHLARKEGCSHRARLVEHLPRLEVRLNQIRAQDAELLENAVKLQLLARSGLESSAWWDQIEHDFSRLRRSLLQHERHEQQLLEEACGRSSATQE